MPRDRWLRAPVALTLCGLVVHAEIGNIPAGLTFKSHPYFFKEWNDGQHLPDEVPQCAETSEGGETCSQTAKPDVLVDDRIDRVRDYYNSERAIRLISEDGPLPAKSFHSPFKVFGISENQYMMVLAGLRSTEKPFKIVRHPQRPNVLDYGCGVGTFARKIAETGCCNVFCVNIAEKQVEEARKLTPAGAVEYAAYDGHRLPYTDGHFDVVFFQESYSFHTPNQCEIAKEFSRILKPGGRLVGLDWMTAHGLTDEEYRYWIGPINIAWEASTGTPEGVAKCLRQAGLERVTLIDTATQAGIPEDKKPRNQFMSFEKDSDEQRLMVGKYGTTRGQLSIASFNVRFRHVYALEAMALAIQNEMYWEGFIVAHKPSS